LGEDFAFALSFTRLHRPTRILTPSLRPFARVRHPPPQTAKGEGKKTKTFTPNARSLNKLRKEGEAVKAKNENL